MDRLFHNFYLRVICLGAVLLMLCNAAMGYPAASNNWHLNSSLQAGHNAELVCKIRVVSVRDAEHLVAGASNVSRKIATAKVVSIVKGKCGDTIQIEASLHPLDMPQSTELHPGECCLVFLKRSDSGYLLNRVRSKARVVAKAVDYQQDDDVLLRLLTEFLAGLKAKDEMIRLQAVEELGYIGDELMEKLKPFQNGDEQSRRVAFYLKQARHAIRKARSDENFVIRNVAVMSSFKLGDPPSLDQTIAILRADPNDFNPADSKSKYGIHDFCISALQRSLLETMDQTTRRSVKDLGDGLTIRATPPQRGIFRGVPGFPYADLYRWALETDIVKNNKDLRRAIANVIWIRYEKESVPQMIQLLDDPERDIRHTAVSALMKCINDNLNTAWDSRSFYSSGWDSIQLMNQLKEMPLEQRQKEYQEHEQEYINYWKSWWSENQGRFSKEPRPVSDM